jgi:hypothetical protein
MGRKGFDLAIAYAERLLGESLAETPPVQLSGWEVVSIVWPLNDVFRPHMVRIKTVRYEARYEREADKAIESFAGHPVADAWLPLSAGAWRVLLERHMQTIMLATLNQAASNSVAIMPQRLPDSGKLPWIMLSLLHSMTLPFPIEDRSSCVIPFGVAPGPMRPQ